ncbi:GIY-YIG nuclease family protein [Noviherbaspirillum malthae]|uniref:GIY-YIG nuclease family protein n=1 Tax=Noviherbaspirillum malthae TaxID=1260987 RepID=UPI002B277D25|nr:GIY-YIG nuclease family protein [Noviherbaspirillum malthae]
MRSQYGVKIGKSVDVRSRTRLFAVKLPFPTTVEHYAWFDDYSFAERDLHRKYHSKRLEGEWFDLSLDDVAHIKTLGRSVPVVGL